MTFFKNIFFSFIAGTHNVVGQIFESIYGRNLSGHSCAKVYVFDTKTKLKDDNTCFYRYVDSEYLFFKVKKVLKEGKGLRVARLCTSAPTLLSNRDVVKLEEVGVMLNGGEHPDQLTIKESEITGKALLVGQYIVSIPNDVSQENY